MGRSKILPIRKKGRMTDKERLDELEKKHTRKNRRKK